MIPTVAGQRISYMEMIEQPKGLWSAFCRFEQDAPELSGTVMIEMGSRKRLGTITRFDGTHMLRRSAVIVGGYGGWSKTVEARQYHLEGGVPAQRVAEDLCLFNGERLGTFVPSSAFLGKDFVRNSTLASTILQTISGSAPWWVQDDGKTNVGDRPSPPVLTDYTVLGYDGANQTIELQLINHADVWIGQTIKGNLATPKTIQSYKLVVDQDGVRAECNVQAGTDLQAIVNQLIDQRIQAAASLPRKYRVLRMLASGRVELQAVKPSLGYPDLTEISELPGIPGVHATLKQGAEVIIGFVDGDRAQPFICNYGDSLTPKWIPEELNLCDGTDGVARQHDSVEVGGPGTIVTFTPVTPSASPMTPGTPYLVSFDSTAPTPLLAAKLTGEITEGSTVVKCG